MRKIELLLISLLKDIGKYLINSNQLIKSLMNRIAWEKIFRFDLYSSNSKSIWIKTIGLSRNQSPEFSVYDKDGANLQYRIEYRYSRQQSIELISYPTKQMVARLKNERQWTKCDALFSVLDPKMHAWVYGSISQCLPISKDRSTIKYYGTYFSMKSNARPLTAFFIDGLQDSSVIGEYKVTFPP